MLPDVKCLENHCVLYWLLLVLAVSGERLSPMFVIPFRTEPELVVDTLEIYFDIYFGESSQDTAGFVLFV